MVQSQRTNSLSAILASFICIRLRGHPLPSLVFPRPLSLDGQSEPCIEIAELDVSFYGFEKCSVMNLSSGFFIGFHWDSISYLLRMF